MGAMLSPCGFEICGYCPAPSPGTHLARRRAAAILTRMLTAGAATILSPRNSGARVRQRARRLPGEDARAQNQMDQFLQPDVNQMPDSNVYTHGIA